MKEKLMPFLDKVLRDTGINATGTEIVYIAEKLADFLKDEVSGAVTAMEEEASPVPPALGVAPVTENQPESLQSETPTE